MNALYENLVAYVREGSCTERSRKFARKLNCHNELALRTVSINVLRWAKLEYKRTLWIQQGRPTKHKPMQLSYADNISPEERAELCEFAYREFNPMKMI